ncbi:MAG TPA: cache domain-containing protein [Ktedonobacteraceae bacterium]|nr:cache domain-containing protein [Ktedonobacteraceae bacterium]
MLQQDYPHRVKKFFSLSMYISVLLALAAILPLAGTIISIEASLKPALVSQEQNLLSNDAKSQVQSIDSYLIERLAEVQNLSESLPVKAFMSGNQAEYSTVYTDLFNNQHLDTSDYISWSILGLHNNVVADYPNAPQKHGKTYILPENLQQVLNSDNAVISDVFYDTQSNLASVDIYARIIDGNLHVVGFVRASLALSRIWNSINSEWQNEGANSYAFLLDQNGVRIGYSNMNQSGNALPKPLFTSIAPLSASVQQRIQSEGLYTGNKSLRMLANASLANMQKSSSLSSTFQFQPIELQKQYTAAMWRSSITPWSYYLVKPSSEITGLADQQLLSTLLIGGIILIIAVAAGLFLGGRITGPILRSVSSLRKNSLLLKELANEEHQVVRDQAWMVEASQLGLKSVQYYTGVGSVAAQRVTKLSIDLIKNARALDAQHLNQALQEIVETASYVERAIRHQEHTNEKLATTLRVTDQVTNQLTKSAESSDAAAAQLEGIVEQLTSIVGKFSS